ncbi:unnamed protein product, partial [Musa textilis]
GKKRGDLEPYKRWRCTPDKLVLLGEGNGHVTSGIRATPGLHQSPQRGCPRRAPQRG